MNVIDLILDCDTIMMTSSHIYNGNQNDCNILSNTFGRDVVSCRNFAVNNRTFLNGLISIVEATFADNSQIVIVSSNGQPVFRYEKSAPNLPPDTYNIRDDDLCWQQDIHILSLFAAQGKL
ncbi:MAG: hypothetical protein II871_03970 [Clostridia bacterium]|nr:hypothetical protein [Clostridia bacterium]